jgi:hypothetical protein
MRTHNILSLITIIICYRARQLFSQRTYTAIYIIIGIGHPGNKSYVEDAPNLIEIRAAF